MLLALLLDTHLRKLLSIALSTPDPYSLIGILVRSLIGIRPTLIGIPLLPDRDPVRFYSRVVLPHTQGGIV